MTHSAAPGGAIPSPGTGNRKGVKPSPLASPSDDLNKQIISMLQEDGRLPYDEIAARLGVSAGTVRNREQCQWVAGFQLPGVRPYLLEE